MDSAKTHSLIIAVISEIGSGRFTLVKYLQDEFKFKVVYNFKQEEEDDNELNIEELTLNQKNIHLSDLILNKENIPIAKYLFNKLKIKSLKERIKTMDDRFIVIYPDCNYQDYLDFQNKPTFRLLNIITPIKYRINNYLGINKESNIDKFLDLSHCESMDENYQRLKLESFITIINNSTLEDFKLKINIIINKLTKYFRPNWDDYFMAIAHIMADRSNCIKQKVGAVIESNKRILSTGYNGTPSKVVNCFQGGCERCNDNQMKQGEGLDRCFCLHAEENAVMEIGRLKCLNATLYTTVYPCLMCAKIIVECGIQKVIYDKEYNSELTEKIFKSANVELIKWHKEINKTI